MLNWVQPFSTFCFLDNNQYQIEPHSQECLVAVGIKRKFLLKPNEPYAGLQHFIDEKKSWLFGHLNYELSKEQKTHSSLHADRILFPDLFFFEPSIVIRLSEKKIIIEAEEPAKIFSAILAAETEEDATDAGKPVIKNRLNKEKYISIIEKLKQHIVRGDCYEINFCQEFFADNAYINPLQVYKKLSDVSPNPFSAFYRLDDRWLICASPERFIKKEGSKVISQPIKGTAKRITDNSTKDEESKRELFTSSKDRSENVMVVDLVRNDLARICKEGTVHVDELYGIYSFPQVHQMISTISGELNDGISFTEIIEATYPMGSMTGAPKKRVMELIEKYEITKRGIFSGAIGYISPAGDFDFNVIIRSILYNSTEQYLSFLAGSGITFYSDPEMEWQECMMKAAAIRQVLSS